MLMFDEIWFLSRALCPRNMQGLPWVRLLDEQKLLPPLDSLEPLNIQGLLDGSPEFERRYIEFGRQIGSDINRIMRTLVSQGDFGLDYHGAGVKLGDVERRTDSLRPENVVFDLEVLRRLNDKRVELVTNSFSQRWLESHENPLLRTKLAESLVVNNIPSYFSSDGPYHECVDEVRDRPFLREFRKRIATVEGLTTERDVDEAKRQLEEEIRRAQDLVFMKHLSKWARLENTGKAIACAGADLLVPFSGTVAGALDNLVDLFKQPEQRWMGFVVSTRSLRS
jgi:hypothetical protein